MKLKIAIICIIFLMVGTITYAGNPGHNVILKVSKAERVKLLSRIVRSSGFDCIGVDTFFQGIYEVDGSVFWNVSCTNGEKYSIQIMPDAVGSFNATSCAILKLFKLECFKRLDEQ